MLLLRGVVIFPFVEPGYLEEYGLGEKAPHAHTNYKLESSNFAVRVAQYQNPLVNRCISYNHLVRNIYIKRRQYSLWATHIRASIIVRLSALFATPP
jgi:hypothetical protein